MMSTTTLPQTPPTLSDADIAEIWKRYSATTKAFRCPNGTWYVDSDHEDGDVYRLAYDDDRRYFGGYLTAARLIQGTPEEKRTDPLWWEGGFERYEDAVFAAKAHDDIPALLMEVARLQTLFMQYADHKPDCHKHSHNWWPEATCTCGLDSALTARTALSAAAPATEGE